MTIRCEHADSEIQSIVQVWQATDPDLTRTAQVFRDTYDQLYNGIYTGRYRWDQLYKTEKTHFGTLLEIGLRREFDDIITDGQAMDFAICGTEIDCKFSQKLGSWMIPNEALNHLLLVAHAADENGIWSLGVVRAMSENLGTSQNRDQKRRLTKEATRSIIWIAHNASLPPNVLLHVDSTIVERIMSRSTGQQRVNDLFRSIQNKRIHRTTIATVAQQVDYMKRVRANGGARSILAPEGIIILSGDYLSHQSIAETLGAVIPKQGEFVSVTIVPAETDEPWAIPLDGCLWRLAVDSDQVQVPAPSLPTLQRDVS